MLRRYPALVFLVAAGFLATMLPSALRLPLSGPTQAAELAPVPGEGDGQEGDLSELGLGSSDGLGTGGRSGGSGAPEVPAAGEVGTGANPRAKRCVGRPPRQTEDPLSPPCVAFFRGDNGGATHQGVTRDEVRVVIVLSGSSQEFIDFSAPMDGTESTTVRNFKVWNRYFNDRYQTYGRHVRLIGYYSPGTQVAGTHAQIRADVVRIRDEQEPFAVVTAADYRSELFAQEAAAAGMLAIAYEGFQRAQYRKVAPLLQSFGPDIEDQGAMAGTWTCRRLAGRPARFAGALVDTSGPRKFGIVYTEASEEPLHAALKDVLVAELRRCGQEPVVASMRLATGGTGANTDEVGAIARMRDEGVTTVFPIVQSGKRNTVTNAAASQGYEPEWVVPALEGMDDAINAQGYNQSQWRRAMGISTDIRRGSLPEQSWAIAYRDACQGCELPAGQAVVRIYDSLSLLFYGLQAAGPRLTPTALDRGMHAIAPRQSEDPYRPAAYFAPGNYSFIKDAAQIWWDAVTPAPGASRPGCYRLPSGGRRHRAGEWPTGDSDLFDPAGSPCQGAKGRRTGEAG